MDDYEKSQRAVMKCRIVGLLQLIPGAVLAGLFLIVLIGIAAGEPGEFGLDFLLFSIFIETVGLGLIALGIKRMQCVARYRVFSACLSAAPESSLEYLALHLGAPLPRIRRQMVKMLCYGFFPGACLAPDGVNLVDCRVWATEPLQPPNPVEPSPGQPFTVEVACPSCCAVCRVPAGGSARCEYCGTELHA